MLNVSVRQKSTEARSSYYCFYHFSKHQEHGLHPCSGRFSNLSTFEAHCLWSKPLLIFFFLPLMIQIICLMCPSFDDLCPKSNNATYIFWVWNVLIFLSTGSLDAVGWSYNLFLYQWDLRYGLSTMWPIQSNRIQWFQSPNCETGSILRFNCRSIMGMTRQ